MIIKKIVIIFAAENALEDAGISQNIVIMTPKPETDTSEH